MKKALEKLHKKQNKKREEFSGFFSFLL